MVIYFKFLKQKIEALCQKQQMKYKEKQLSNK